MQRSATISYSINTKQITVISIIENLLISCVSLGAGTGYGLANIYTILLYTYNTISLCLLSLFITIYNANKSPCLKSTRSSRITTMIKKTFACILMLLTVVYMHYRILPEIKLSYLILTYLILLPVTPGRG